jgi:hypothetical protein
MSIAFRVSKKFVAFALAACALAVAATSPAYADSIPWKYASWGRAWFVVQTITQAGTLHAIFGDAQDIRTDGYCVYVRVRRAGESWPALSLRSSSRSCGSITTYDQFMVSARIVGARLYRDDGRYLTLYGS